MHEGLMNSPEHLANILNPDVSYVGIGLSVGHGRRRRPATWPS